MTDRTATAERCLLATCAHLSMTTVRDENGQLWLGVLRDVLLDCATCATVLIPLRDAADQLAHAATRRARDNAMARLRFETQQYFALVAAQRFEAWKQQKGSQHAAA